MTNQTLTLGAQVHYVDGDTHCVAVVTALAVPFPPGHVALTVFPPLRDPFTTTADYDAQANDFTWHWPEEEERGVVWTT